MGGAILAVAISYPVKPVGDEPIRTAKLLHPAREREALHLPNNFVKCDFSDGPPKSSIRVFANLYKSGRQRMLAGTQKMTTAIISVSPRRPNTEQIANVIPNVRKPQRSICAGDRQSSREQPGQM